MIIEPRFPCSSWFSLTFFQAVVSINIELKKKEKKLKCLGLLCEVKEEQWSLKGKVRKLLFKACEKFCYVFLCYVSNGNSKKINLTEI